MTVGKITTPNSSIDSQIREIREERAWLREMNGKLSQMLEIAEKTSNEIDELSDRIDILNQSMDEQLRSSELMERHVAESPKVRFYNGNSTSKTMHDRPTTMKDIAVAIRESLSRKFLNFLKSIWNFFTFKS